MSQIGLLQSETVTVTDEADENEESGPLRMNQFCSQPSI